MKLKKRWCVSLISLFAFLSPAGAVEFNAVQLNQSKIDFTFRQMGVPLTGEFRKFSAQISFDPAKPEQAKSVIEIDLASIDAGNDEANDEVKGPQWFNTKVYPSARFESSSVRALGGDRYEVSGTMRIKGKGRPLTASFSVKQGTGVATFDGNFVLKRGDYAIGDGPWADYGTVANEIQVHFRIPVAARTGK